MGYIKEGSIILGVTMIGEVLNRLLDLPIPAGVYGLFLLLLALYTGIIKLEEIEHTGNFLLDAMPMMFVPVAAGLLSHLDILKQIAFPLVVISILSTVIVLGATGRMVEVISNENHKNDKDHEKEEEQA